MPDLIWPLSAVLLLPCGVILVHAVIETLRARRIRTWPQSSGRVVISAAELRDVRLMDTAREAGYRLEPRNFAKIIYEYSVNGQRLRSDRIDLGGENPGNFQVAETLARYPVGRTVTVYYNPRKPSEAVLERDLPEGLWGCIGLGTVIACSIVFGSAWGFGQIGEFVYARITRPEFAPLVIAFGAFAFVMALFALAMHRSASLASRWPVVPGTIKLSDFETYRLNRRLLRDPGLLFRWRRPGPVVHGRRVLYTYRYNDVTYTNMHAFLGRESTSVMNRMLRKLMPRHYEDGAIVDVYVNPDNPAQATLDPRASFAWVLWLIAAILAALACLVATR